MKYYVLYNPQAGHGEVSKKLTELETHLDGEIVEFSVAEDYRPLIASLSPDDVIVLSGGDGTLNNFINAIDTEALENDVLYYASGSGNDFLNDLDKKYPCPPFKINKYLKNLPTVTVKGKSYRFINGIGYGVDGYCCQEGDKLKARGKAVNYTAIAIKGLLYDYKPRNATVIIDGKEYNFKKVWVAPTMFGRYFGGGMMATPDQDRLGDGRVTFMTFEGSSALTTLLIFPKIFKGEHVKHTKYIRIMKGTDITVKFDKPCALQIDGETILDVEEYSVHANLKK